LLEFLKLLDSSNFSYVSWKNNHELDSALTGKSDLDILIFDKTFHEFNAIAYEHGWIEMENPVAKFDSIFHFYKVNQDTTISHLHVYFEVVTGDGWLKEYNLPLKEFLFLNRESDYRRGVYVLNSKAQAYIFLIRHLIKSGSFFSRLIYRMELDSYKEEWSRCNLAVDELYGIGPIPIDDWIKDSGLLKFFQQPKYFVALRYRQFLHQYLRYKRYSLIFRRLISLFRRSYNKLISKNKKKFINGGIVIAISGADGAGKSSMIAGLHSLYSSFLDCKMFALGKPQGKLLEYVRFFIRRGDKFEPTHLNSYQKQSSIKDAILACALAILRLRKASAALRKARKGNMVLVDRWPTNDFGKMDGPKIVGLGTGSRLINSLAMFEKTIYERIPPADICFYLEVDIDEARKRNFERVKDGKETDEMIIMRHQNNQETIPITNRLIRFTNNGSYKKMFPILAYDIWNEMATFKHK
jgi:thymidylate kinase